jgi:hypothetical protein
MFMKRLASRYSALLTAAVLFVPAAIAAAPGSDVCTPSTPCSCSTPTFSVQLIDKTVTPGTTTTQTTTKYTYKVSGSPAKINGIVNGQFVIPRPVANVTSATSGDILVQGSGTGSGVFNVLNYCDSDKNTGINKGNCDGFLAYVAPSALTNTSVNMVVVSGQRVADGLITINIVSGTGSSEICQALDANNVPTGIVGPGDIGDPFQPKFTLQNASVAGGKCTAHLIFDKHGNVSDVTTDPPCVTGSPVGDIIVNGAPLKNNTGPHGITFGTGTSTCYGPSIPSPAKCVCTASPCP